jgi:hypothetical protein
MTTSLSQTLSVDRPAIATVLDSISGMDVPVVRVMGSDYERLMRLRMEVKTAIHEGQPMYLCAECFTPVYICRRKERNRFFFRHSKEDGRCSAITRGELSQQEISARKYNGAKESHLHRQMKEWLVESLLACGGFREIQAESRWTGAITGQWRQPDVVAKLHDLKIAFEVQLSTTFLNVIAERRLFYLKEGGLLFWVFARFDADARRLTLDDVFYNNNQNAFVVSRATRDASVAAGDFLLDCVWSEPAAGQAEPHLRQGRVSFRDLTLDQRRQQAYFSDYATARTQQAREGASERANWPQEFERWFLEIAEKHSSLYDQEHELATFPEGVPVHWADGGMLTNTPLRHYGKELRLPVAMLDALYSVKHGRPVGLSRKLFIEVAHYVAASYPRYLLWFHYALHAYGRAALLTQQDKSGKWAKRVKAHTQDMQDNPEGYASDQKHQALFESLFSELVPLPQWPDDDVLKMLRQQHGR